MSFADVVGQESAIRLLKGQLAQGRWAHATLFVGAEGIGKRSLALEFARALICERPLADGGCGRCGSCGWVAAGTHPDLLVTAPRDRTESGEKRKTRQIDIEQIRELKERMGLTPFSGRWKVAILDEAESLGDQAVPACLQMLEEPTERSLFLLIAPAEHLLPATVVSRCHLVRCRPQGVERVAAALQEREGLDPARARLLAALAGGRMGLALRLLRADRLTLKNAALDQLLSARRRGELEVPLGKASREEIAEALEWYAAWWRDLLVLALQGDPAWIFHQDRLGDLKAVIASPPSASLRAGSGAKQSPRDPTDFLAQIERTYWIREAIQGNASPRNALALLLSQ